MQRLIMKKKQCETFTVFFFVRKWCKFSFNDDFSHFATERDEEEETPKRGYQSFNDKQLNIKQKIDTVFLRTNSNK